VGDVVLKVISALLLVTVSILIFEKDGGVVVDCFCKGVGVSFIAGVAVVLVTGA
jgi:hypothetical protein